MTDKPPPLGTRLERGIPYGADVIRGNIIGVWVAPMGGVPSVMLAFATDTAKTLLYVPLSDGVTLAECLVYLLEDKQALEDLARAVERRGT